MRTISLTQGQITFVDDTDFNWLNNCKCWANFINGNWYALVLIDKKPILMHRAIMNSQKGQEIDHHDHNTLNNQKYNLRVCTRSQNNANQRIQLRTKTSQYKGVHWHKNKHKWLTSIKKNRKQIHCGYYKNEKEAAKAYDAKAKELFGEFAYLNF